MHVLKYSGTFVLRTGKFPSWTTQKIYSHDARNVENTAKPDMPRHQDLVQPLHLHRNCDQRGWWKFFLKGDKDNGWVQSSSLSLLKRPCLPLKLLEKHWQAAQASAGQGSSLADGVGQKAQLMEVISGEQVNGNS